MTDIVEVDNAVKVFHRGIEEIRAIDGIDLAIPRGDYLAVVGPSGSGKTTLLNLIGCVDRPTSGRVTVHGLETEDMSDRALATIRSTTIGFVFQHFFLIPTLTAVENVMVPSRFCAKHIDGVVRQRAEKLLDLVGLSARIDHLPRELSGGEMQRVALARSLINEPDMLLADEPTGNLDTRNAEEIAAIFEELNAGGLTIVVVTHNPDLATNATRAVHLSDGAIVEERSLRDKATPIVVAEPEEAPEPEAASAPEYMPASIKKRKWGSPAVSAAMVILGAVMLLAAFMPFLGETTGYGLMDQGTFTVTIYRGNPLTQTFFGSPGTLFTGVWAMVLGSLLVIAGVFYLFRRRRIAAWSAVVSGGIGVVASAVSLVMILARLRPDFSAGYGLWVMLGASIASLALGIWLVVRRSHS
ncbi:MAG: ATP-binding cassette domain-containing protein [Actinomycetota bacterium]